MGKTREWIEWGTWLCSSCGTKTSGEFKTCKACGNPREKAELDKVSFDEVRIAATEAERTLALSGSDWHCKNCEAGNRGTSSKCEKCGSNRNGEPPASEATKPEAPSAYESLSNYGGPKVESDPYRKLFEAKPESNEDRLKAERNIVFTAFGVGFTTAMTVAAAVSSVLLLSLMAYSVWWSFQTYAEAGQVTSMKWEQRVHRDNFHEVTLQDWKANLWLKPTVLPKNGVGESPGIDNIRNCSQKYHHTRHYVCGSERVCHTKTRSVANGESCHTSCSNNSNGSRSCHEVCSTRYRSENYQACGQEDKYCDEKIFRPFCSYDTWQWDQVAVTVLNGNDEKTAWPVVSPGPLDRTHRSADYRINVHYTEGSEGFDTYDTPDTEAEYQAWRVGAPAVVVIYNMGSVAEVKHPEKVEK